MRPGSSQNPTKNEAKNDREKCMKKGHAEAAGAAEKMGRGEGVPSKT